ncbi:hypothetical protein HD554DRAFT_2038269 [Boletus coccyginus]|nr:hypothetical protein HD554DRAFT_2038269 [Boletus coccyginus]
MQLGTKLKLKLPNQFGLIWLWLSDKPANMELSHYAHEDPAVHKGLIPRDMKNLDSWVSKRLARPELWADSKSELEDISKAGPGNSELLRAESIAEIEESPSVSKMAGPGNSKQPRAENVGEIKESPSVSEMYTLLGFQPHKPLLCVRLNCKVFPPTLTAHALPGSSGFHSEPSYQVPHIASKDLISKLESDNDIRPTILI